MQLMVQGDKFELYIPSELAYGDSGSPPKIPGGSVLIFQMEILDISGTITDFVPAIKCQLSGEKCNDKEKGYVEKVKDWTKEKATAEINRLQNIMEKQHSTKPELINWVDRRLRILRQVVPDYNESGGDEVDATKEDSKEL